MASINQNELNRNRATRRARRVLRTLVEPLENRRLLSALLETAGDFAVLGGSTVTNTGGSAIVSNVGVSPGTAITGFPPGVITGGAIHAGDAVAAQAHADLITAYGAIAGEAPGRFNNLTGQDLGGLTLLPGVYHFDSTAGLAGFLTLDAQGDPNARFDFQIGSTLTTASNSVVNIINGGSADNVYFQVGTSATLATGTAFKGNILANQSITLATGATMLDGRALAATGAVTMDTNQITASSAAASELVFTQQPADAAAGQPIGAVIVEVTDVDGRLVRTDNSTVTLAAAGLTGTTSVAAVAGVATFTGLSMTLAGSRALTAIDGSLTSATSNSITITPAAASQLAFSVQPTSTMAGASIGTVVAKVEDAYGNIVTTDTTLVTLSGTSLTGTLSVAAVNGVATFNSLWMTQVGSRALTATDGSLNAATSHVISITPAAASELVVVQQPINAVAGQAIGTVLVNVDDAYGNIVTTDASTVSLAGTSLTGNTAVAAVNGVATFTGLSMTLAGTRTLTATDGSLTATTSSSIIITPAVESRLVIVQQPMDAVAGQTVGIVIVNIEDAYGNLLTTDTSTVTLSGSTAVGGTTSVSAVGGVATLARLTMTQAGTQTLTASDGGLTPATSNAFTIAPAAAIHLEVTREPNNTMAGQSIGTIVVEILDTYGNVVTIDTSLLTLATGNATAISGTVSMHAIAGLATFTGLSISQTGRYTLSATDGSLTPATTRSFSIAPAPPNQLVFAQQPGNVSAGQPIGTLMLSVEDAFGNIVTTDASTVSLAATSLAGATSVTAVAGVATFTGLSMTLAGSRRLTATDGSLTSATSNLITITPAAASQLVFTGQPGNATAGQSIGTVVVRVEDAYSNVVTTNASTVSLAGTSLTGTTSVVAVAGVATFTSLSMTRAGLQSLTATDGSLTSATSNSVTITNAAASQLVFTQQPGNAIAGQSIGTIILFVEDVYGNLVTTDHSNVMLASNTAVGGTTTVEAVNGVARFYDLSVIVAGAHMLSAVDTNLSAATSLAFNIVPAVASRLVIVQQPEGVVIAGQNIGAIEVEIQDAFGNLVTTDRSNVTVATDGILRGILTVAAVNGVARLTELSINLVGTYTLLATDSSLTSVASNSVNIIPAAASQLVIVQQPGNATAGHPIGTVIVHVEDAFGNLIAADSSDVTLSANTALGGETTMLTVHGVATFDDISIARAGTYTLSLARSHVPLVETNSITIAAAAAAKLVIAQQPTGTVAGQTIATMTVSVEDMFGNLIPTDTSSVTVSSSASIDGTTVIATQGGVARFIDLSITHAGTYTMSVSDGSLTSETSNSFTITSASALRLVLTQQPTNATAGQSMGATVVDITDAYGNIVVTEHSNVTLSVGASTVGDPLSNPVLSGTTTVAARNGVAIFGDLSITPGGTYILAATAAALTGAVTEPISIIDRPTVVLVSPNVRTRSRRTTLKVLPTETSTLGESGLTYTWSVMKSPSGAKHVAFTDNGTNMARNTSARFRKAGTYLLRCLVTNPEGNSVLASVSVKVKQNPTMLRLKPHRQVITARGSMQYTGIALDQFGLRMRGEQTLTYAVSSGKGSIDQDGLFTASAEKGHVVIRIGINYLWGTVGATVVRLRG